MSSSADAGGDASSVQPPDLAAIRAARETLGGRIRETPVWRWQGPALVGALDADTEVWLKLELWQHGGSFKVRGALLNLAALDAGQLERGVVTVSAGNHAIALSFAARQYGTHAKVVMPRSANPARVDRVRALGGEVVAVADVHAAFDEAARLESEEGRAFVHPFEGPNVALGTGTLGLEFLEQVPELDALVVPIGGGGLIAGVATAARHVRPDVLVLGVEPEGADTMYRSFAAGKPVGIERVQTIADSLGAPRAEPYSYALTRRAVDQLVRVDDDALRRAMGLMFDDLALAVEPAAAAATAALVGPLARQLRGKRIGLVVCGSNVDLDSYVRMRRG